MTKALPTLEDVALAAGVSTATVSRCLNTPERVAESTRIKVTEAVATLGYSPNFGAKALASKRTNTYGAIIPTMNNAIFATGLQAFQETLAEHGATLLVASSNYDPQVEEEQIRAMIARGADGLLLIGQSRSEEIYQFLEQQNIPIVLAWSYDANSKYNMVGFDNAAAMFDMTQRAIEFGHKRFAFISAERQHNDRATERVRGTQQALTAAGLDADILPIVEVPYSMELGIDVPRDLSITGFDDLEISRVVEPEIMTVHVPHRQMGRRAAEQLVTQSSKLEHGSIKLQTHLPSPALLTRNQQVHAFVGAG